MTLVELGPDVTYLQAQFDALPTADKDALLAFFAHPLVRWGLFVCTFTSEEGIDYQVQYWGPHPISCVESSSALYDLQFLLRVKG